MAREAFVEKRFGAERLAVIAKANEIIAEYQAAGYRLTLRQLYYQLVSRAIIPNTERSYKNLGNVVSEGRLAGLIDWDAIEDRNRVPKKASEFSGLPDLVEAAVASYRLPRWEGQENYVELWVEKDALAGVLEPIAREFHVTLQVNKGYSSQSAMYEAANRFRTNEPRRNLPVLLYLGDHDASGEDMVRDVRDRLFMFGVNVDVRKVALTMGQVEEYGPPPNPAKMTDSRAAAYVAEHGVHSWEVDALPPDVLADLVCGALAALVDRAKMEAVVRREKRDKAALRKAVRGLRGGRA